MRHLTDEHKKAMGEAIRKKWLTYSKEKKEAMKAKQRKTIAEKEAIIKIWGKLSENENIKNLIIQELNKDKDNK
ncbi:hypothetical protein [Hoylesella timonensis]|uniref:hypothetical protein n=1 Tax=Hoylesella timonensis TaxID=386414 RepID=UPI00336A855B